MSPSSGVVSEHLTADLAVLYQLNQFNVDVIRQGVMDVGDRTSKSYNGSRQGLSSRPIESAFAASSGYVDR
jgi:hypothetical protein